MKTQKRQTSDFRIEKLDAKDLMTKTLYVFLPYSRIKTWTSHFLFKNINPHYLDQLRDQLKDEGWKKFTTVSSASRSASSKGKLNISDVFSRKILSASTEYGTHLRLQFFPKTLEAYQLHTWMRKNIKLKGCHVGICIQDLNVTFQMKIVEALASFNEISQWKSPQYGKADLKKPSLKRLSSITLMTTVSKQILQRTIKRGLALGQGNNLVRTLAMTPSNFLTPKLYLNIIKKRATQKKYRVEFWDKKQLKVFKAGAFLSVAQGSKNRESGIVHLSYKPQRTKGRVALVGKGVCFDTGGYNLKPDNYMLTMHRDMTGSAVALALFETLLEYPLEIHAYLGLVENLISEEASHPNEVVVASNGTSIEIVNTDAEGRMTLADTLALCRKSKPDLILDFATLTGGAVYSIGTRRSAIFSNREKYLKLGYECGQLSGERVWGFPSGGDFEEKLKSNIADTLQCSSSRGIDHILAATFLRRFVGEETPWIHMDLSSESNQGGLGLVENEVTGYGVRWGFEVVKSFYKLKT